MKHRLASLGAPFAIALLLASGPLPAQEASAPQPQTAPSGVQYVSGGIGDKQQAAMKALRKDYNLRLTFARPKSGDYLADVKVTVENAKKEKVLDVVSPGPLLFANLPAGRYTVAAELEGQRQVKKATLKSGRPRGLVYYFAKK